MQKFKTYLNSPIGTIEINGSALGIEGIYFKNIKIEKNEVPEVLHEAYKQIEEYFLKKRKSFDFKLNPQGTEFQKKTWNELSKIPYGQTISYLELAKRVGNPKASRAVANANSRNPLSIVVPCHRVIGSNGKLIGYAGGLDRKQFLIILESNL